MKPLQCLTLLALSLDMASCGGIAGTGPATSLARSGAFNAAVTGRQTDPFDKEAVLHDFGARADGKLPLSGLLAGKNGELYGTTYDGGAHGLGSVFEISTAGKERVIYSFRGGYDGENPVGGLIEDSAGNLYGTTEYGGNWGACGQRSCGTVFELKRAQTKYRERRLYVFKAPNDGEFPMGGVLLGKNGVLYGTTNVGGNIQAPCFPDSCGTVFALIPNGKGYTKQIVYDFRGDTDGAYPSGSLIADSRGIIYGTTEFGGGTNSKCTSSPSGTGSCGTVYKVTPKGFETVLRRFRGGTRDGANPVAGLLSGSGGIVYGVTEYGGGSGSGAGTVFALTVEGRDHTEKILHRFCSAAHCADGKNPIDSAGLRIDGSGDLYGTTQLGGDATCACGTVFMLSFSASGYTEKVLHRFGGSNGSKPDASVLLSGKTVLGTTEYGGRDLSHCKSGCGVVYDLTP
jgi:uncharacterized repeat protein (TIGR03803 family)